MTIQTAWIAAPLVLLIAILGLRISGLRLSGQARSKDAATLDRFARWQRAHGNAVEHVPIVLVMLLLCELMHAGRGLVLGIGGVFLLSRVLHAVGTVVPRKWFKFTGAALTYGVELALGVLLIVKLLQAG
jgi:uncharacterized membrane protein YecN with MAPEG domain